MPRLFDILFTIRLIWFYHVKFSLNKTPKNFILSIRFIKGIAYF